MYDFFYITSKVIHHRIDFCLYFLCAPPGGTREVAKPGSHLPSHIHVATADLEGKFWLDPVRLARKKGVHSVTMRDIEKFVLKIGSS